jgi:hypothetical protein
MHHILVKRRFAQNGCEGIVVDLLFRVGIIEGFITTFLRKL